MPPETTPLFTDTGIRHTRGGPDADPTVLAIDKTLSAEQQSVLQALAVGLEPEQIERLLNISGRQVDRHSALVRWRFKDRGDIPEITSHLFTEGQQLAVATGSGTSGTGSISDGSDA